MEKSSEFEINIRNVDVRLNDSCTTESNMNGDVDNSLYISSPVETEAQIKLFKNESTDKYLETVSEASKIYQQCKDSSSGLLNGCHKTMHEEIKRVDFTMNGINKCNNLELLNSQLDKLNFRTCEQTVGEHDEDTRTNLNSKESTSVNPSCFIPELSSSEISNSSKVNTTCDAQDVKTDITKLKSDPKDEILKDVNIIYLGYDSEKQMPDIMRLIQKDLSEPYSIYTYRYFIHNWPKLCFLAQYEDQCVGAIVCKLDVHKKQCRRGYIAMLAVDKKYRKRKIGSNLVLKAIQAMVEDNADEVVLETEITNKSALRLYENLGFVRDKRLFRYYLNGVDALRLKLWLR